MLRNLRNNNAGIVGVMGYANDFYPSSGNQYNDNVWHLIGVTYDFLKELKTYIDGNLDNNISEFLCSCFPFVPFSMPPFDTYQYHGRFLFPQLLKFFPVNLYQN